MLSNKGHDQYPHTLSAILSIFHTKLNNLKVQLVPKPQILFTLKLMQIRNLCLSSVA